METYAFARHNASVMQAIAVFFVALLPAAAHARIVQGTFTTTVTDTADGIPLLSTPFSGTFTFDDAFDPDAAEFTNRFKNYHMLNLKSFEVTGGDTGEACCYQAYQGNQIIFRRDGVVSGLSTVLVNTTLRRTLWFGVSSDEFRITGLDWNEGTYTDFSNTGIRGGRYILTAPTIQPIAGQIVGPAIPEPSLPLSLLAGLLAIALSKIHVRRARQSSEC